MKKALYGYSRYVAEKDGVLLQKECLDQDGEQFQRREIRTLKIDPPGSPMGEVITEMGGVPDGGNSEFI